MPLSSYVQCSLRSKTVAVKRQEAAFRHFVPGLRASCLAALAGGKLLASSNANARVGGAEIMVHAMVKGFEGRVGLDGVAAFTAHATPASLAKDGPWRRSRGWHGSDLIHSPDSAVPASQHRGPGWNLFGIRTGAVLVLVAKLAIASRNPGALKPS